MSLIQDPIWTAGGFHWVLWMAAGGVLFVLPGWALGNALLSRWSELHFLEKPGLAIGLSLAIYPLLLLWLDTIGLRLGAVTAWFPALSAVLWLAYQAKQRGIIKKHHIQFRPAAAEAGFLGVIGLIMISRILAVRGLEIPLWGDSFQHSMITQLILDHGGLFRDWSPYAELKTFTYNYGFHAAAAAFAWVTQMPAVQAVLIFGQIVNLFAVIALGTLAMRVYPSPWSATLAMLIGGLVLWHPNIYTQWGRYTQLTGQAILPAAVCLSWSILEHPPQYRREWIPPCIALAGLGLTHYRVLLFAAFFFVTWLVMEFVRWTGQKRQASLDINRAPLSAPPAMSAPNPAWIRIAGLITGAGLLYFPWLLRLPGGRMLLNLMRQIVTPPEKLSEFARNYNAFGNLPAFLPLIAWLALATTVVWALKERRKAALTVALWWSILLLATNPNWLALPGSGVISNFAYWIAAYIPVAVLVGAGAGRLVDALAQRFTDRRLQSVVFITAMMIGLWGVFLRSSELAIDTHTLVTPSDLEAMAWIETNLPPDARFLVNSLPAYGGSLVAGTDAGWWLPLLAHRSTTLPPLNYGVEAGPREDYVQWINQLPHTIAKKGVNHPRSRGLLMTREVNYVYIGNQQSSVQENLSVEDLLADPRIQLIYQKDRVYIFKLMTKADGPS